MANPWARDRATLFYLGYAVLGLAIISLGFGVTYVLPMARHNFSAPWYVHFHGATALSWILMLIVQAQLVRNRRTPFHRRLGQVALPLALALWASGIATAHWAAQRDLPQAGTTATSSFGGTAIGLSLFLILAAAGLALRRKPDWHKRLILLASIHVLWPAFFRLRHLLPMVPKPEIVLAFMLPYSPILVAALRDKWRYGKVHPVWLFVAPALVIEQSVETVFFDQGIHRAFGQWLFALLG